MPDILKLARANDIRLVFFRVKRRPNPKNIAPDPKLDLYTAQLTAYLAQNGAAFFDEAKDPALTLDYYSADDHIAPARRADYTEQFWAKRGALIEQIVQQNGEGNTL